MARTIRKLKRDFMAYLIEILAAGGLAVLLVWLPLNHFASNSFARRIARGEIMNALRGAATRRQWHVLLPYLKRDLALPDESLRPLIVETSEKLIALGDSLGPRNPIPELLQKQSGEQIVAAFDALFYACARLSIVAGQGVSAESLRAELGAENANLRQLLEATEAASVELARLTLLAGGGQMPASSQQFGQLGWAASELNRLNRQLEE